MQPHRNPALGADSHPMPLGTISVIQITHMSLRLRYLSAAFLGSKSFQLLLLFCICQNGVLLEECTPVLCFPGLRVRK